MVFVLDLIEIHSVRIRKPYIFSRNSVFLTSLKETSHPKAKIKNQEHRKHLNFSLSPFSIHLHKFLLSFQPVIRRRFGTAPTYLSQLGTQLSSQNMSTFAMLCMVVESGTCGCNPFKHQLLHIVSSTVYNLPACEFTLQIYTMQL